MRAFSRRILAPLLMAATVFAAGQQLYTMTAGAGAAGAAVAGCPFGTHWDVTTATCH
jgi:hypothetical protein